MSNEKSLTLPCRECPEEPTEARLLGIYPMRTKGLYLQRIKVHAGRLTAGQWRAVAEMARTFTPDYPLHLTTRQDIELHGLHWDYIPTVQQALAEAGLTTLGAGGDTLRNVTTCPGNGICPNSWEVSTLAAAIEAGAEALPWIRELPRKFKISVSGCKQACARPWVNCLGFVAGSHGTLRAIAGGSLGRRPATGIPVYENLQPGEVVPLVRAALRLFNAEGDREIRSRARFRHVRERLGDEGFRRSLHGLFRQEVREGTPPSPLFPSAQGSARLLARLYLPFGDIAPPTAIELADAAEEAGATMGLGFEHDLFLFGERSIVLTAELEALAAGPSVVSCPGSTWCARGIVDSREAERRLRRVLQDGPELRLAISGCPNNCTHAAVADIGLTGRVKNVDGTRTEGFALVAGGGKGASPALARALHPFVPAREVSSVVAWLLAEYATASSAGDLSFEQFIAQQGDRLSRTLAQRL